MIANLASAHAAMGRIQRYDWDLGGGRGEPSEGAGARTRQRERRCFGAGWLAAELGRPDEALKLIGKSVDLDPLNVVAYDYLGSVFDPVGRVR